MIGAMYNGPGPANYALPGCTGTTAIDVRITHTAAYTMRPQLTQAFGGPKSPGPGVYAIPSGQFRDGTFKGSEYTMRIKPKDLKGSGLAPGPGKYGAPSPTTTTEKTAPAYTMRPYLAGKSKGGQTPGANNYKLPSLIGGPVTFSGLKGKFGSTAQWSMTGRSDVGSFANTRFRAPGPGKYAPELMFHKTKEEAPSYTMRARTYQPTSGTSTPGPKYNIRGQGSKPRKAVTGGTFGSRHSQYTYIVCE